MRKPYSLFAILSLFISANAFAGSHVIGVIDSVTISDKPGVTPAIDGITFDDIAPGQPLVSGSSGLHLARLNPTTAAITHLYNLPGAVSRNLDYIGGGLYYQTRNQPDQLFTLNPAISTATAVGSSLNGTLFNFLNTAIDPTTGNLWAISDNNGGELLEINRTTGVATHKGFITGLNQVVSLAIDPNGTFFVSNASGNTNVQDQIFELNPTTMATTPMTTTGYFASDYLSDFAYDPSSKQWFGVIESRSTAQWLLVNLTNVPEPTTLFLAAAAVPVLVLRRKARGSGND